MSGRRVRGADRPATGRPSVVFLAAAGLVVVASVAIRLVLLGRQSYWIDELFSVNQASGSLASALRIGADEVHTPLYAGLLWAWIHLGGPGETWTRLLGAVCAVASVLVAYRALRPAGLDAYVRWALTAATAAGGAGMVYSLEARNYAPLFLGAVGLTAVTLGAAVRTLAGDGVPWRAYAAWTAWSAVAATVHLFGAVLTAGAAAVLVAVTVVARLRGDRRDLVPVIAWPVCAVIGCALQAAWLLHGRGDPAFAAGTQWITAPGARDVADLLTTAFGTGALVMHAGGFAWTSPVGALVAAAVVAAAVVAGLIRGPGRRRPAASTARGNRRPAATAEGTAAVVLLVLAATVIGGSYAVAQWRHVWTLRNMIIVAPALLWGVVCCAAAICASTPGRRRVAALAVAALGVSLVPIAQGLDRPYKTDFRGAFAYAAAVRAGRPDAVVFFVGRPPAWGWQTPVDGAPGTVAWHPLYRNVPLRPELYQSRVVRTSGTEVVISYPGVDHPALDAETLALATRLGRSCHPVPFRGVGVVRCG